MRILQAVKRMGIRRVTFAAFCIAMIALCARYIYEGPHEGDHGLGVAMVPVMVMFGLLAIGSRWLIPSGGLADLAERVKVCEIERKRFWLVALLAIVTASILWGQRLDKSLWTDEVTSMRENIVGRWKHKNDDDGGLKRPTTGETWFEYATPNNHALYSGVTRWTHERLIGVNDSDFSKPYFSETVLRLPAYLAALLSLPLLGYLALRLGSLLAASLAMGWAVLHPWYLEFSTSARGYGFAILFLTLSVVAAVKIFRGGGGWRWWIIFGMAQVLAFFSVPTLAHALVLLNVAVFAGLLFDKSVIPSSRAPHLRSFFATNLVATAFAILTYLPKHEVFQEYLEGNHFTHTMPWTWMEDCLSNFFVGQPYLVWDEAHPWSFATSQWPVVLLILGILIAVACAAASQVASWKRGIFVGLLGLALFLPPFTVYLQGKAMQFYLFPWYSVWQLPLWITFFSIGAAELFDRLVGRLKEPKPWMAPTCIGVLLMALTAATHYPRIAYLTVPVEPQRESALLMGRDSINPFAPGHDKIITTSLVTANHAYDPWNRRLRSVDDLWEQISYAEESGKPLYLDTAWIERVRSNHKECAKLLLNPNYFELAGEPLYGLQPQNTRYVFRYKPGSLADQVTERKRKANAGTGDKE